MVWRRASKCLKCSEVGIVACEGVQLVEHERTLRCGSYWTDSAKNSWRIDDHNAPVRPRRECCIY